MKRWLITAAVLLALLGVGGLLAVASGIIPITASSGHFAVTEWLLVFSKRRSVATHTSWKEPPPLGDPAQILKGAGHFEAGCRPCHGAPDLPRLPRVPRAMLPPPPNLSVVAPTYQPEELFYIVKHGIKFTGMPAWPSQVRDDEVAALVAFLVALPKLDAAGYRQLVHGKPTNATPSNAAPSNATPSNAAPSNAAPSNAAPSNAASPSTAASIAAAASAAEPLDVLVGAEGAPRAVLSSCGRCHGMDGLGRGNAAFPTLAGQRQQYLVVALEAYAADRRQSGIMQPSAAALPAEEMRQIAAYYSRLPGRRARGTLSVSDADAGDAANRAGRDAANDAASIERGRQIAERGVPERRVPSCSDCHGPGPELEGAAAPVLAGQYADYLILQLQLFADKRRGGSDRAHLMDEVAPRMTHDEMRDAARYYESLAP
jgi:cytochrome c553